MYILHTGQYMNRLLVNLPVYQARHYKSGEKKKRFSYPDYFTYPVYIPALAPWPKVYG